MCIAGVAPSALLAMARAVARCAMLQMLLLPDAMGNSVGHPKVPKAMTPEEQAVLTLIGLMAFSLWAVLLALCLCGDCCAQRPPIAQAQWETLSEAQRKSVTAVEVEQRFPLTRAEGNPMCVVCLSPIGAEDRCRVTQCGHTFHADCVLRWWMYRPRRVLHCPVCRQRQRPV
mmetsp:Transcript_87250/g.242017  ORF Transcript_87250/g.242017 Transcript_87250/m.242017 type:complete len:172 (-) Transcript_87250:76-591(-)